MFEKHYNLKKSLFIPNLSFMNTQKNSVKEMHRDLSMQERLNYERIGSE